MREGITTSEVVAARTAAERALEAIRPWDDVEREHRADALAWVRGPQPIWRTRTPDEPPKHLVSYFVLVDPSARRCLLVDHRSAGLWLPSGGHVEVGEEPEVTVSRELDEELGVELPLLDGLSTNPLFVTVTRTVDPVAGHTDVSLWFVCRAEVDVALAPDPAEFHGVRWWSLDELAGSDGRGFDPHLPRFSTKLLAELGGP